MKNVRIIVFGLGPMGKLIAKAVLERKGLEIVGAVDVARELVAKDLGKILEMDKKLGVTVTNDARRLLASTKADIAIIATGSRLKDVYPQIALCLKSGISVISTCEELFYPQYKHPQLASKINELAQKHSTTVLGTGINPGYLMDVLPIFLTTACLQVKSIKVTRMMDSSKRRVPYQKKIGMGLSPKEFRKMIDEKKITGHVGLIESIAIIADTLGWKLEKIEEKPPEPIIARKTKKTAYTVIKPGSIAGLKSTAYGIKDGAPVITLEFVSHAEVDEEFDAVQIEGKPKIYEKIIGGINGDTGTTAVIINMIPKVLSAKPGLVTMVNLPLPCITLKV